MINKKSIKEHYKKRLLEIKDQEIEKGQVVLLGDCVIEQVDISQQVEDYIVYNNGISGDTTIQLQDTLYKRAIKYKPSKLFLSIGSNDIGFDHRDVKQIYNNIVEIIEEVKRRSKDTKIYIVSVIPVNPSTSSFINRDYVDHRDNFEINMLNFYIKNYARKSKVTYIDASRELKNNYDTLHLKYTIDGFHLNEEGINIVSALIMKHV
jgi:lysophospholipase L1-like esterase